MSETDKKSLYEKVKKYILENSNLIKNICNQILSLAHNSNLIALFPRPDYKGFGYIPQIFFIFIKEDYLEVNLTSTSSDKAIINFQSRKAEYASYNVISQPNTINLTKGILTSLYEEAIISQLKRTIFGNTVFRFSKNLVKKQFIERFNAGVYYSIFSQAFGFHETAVITNLKLKDTTYRDQIEVDLGIKIIKTFSIIT